MIKIKEIVKNKEIDYVDLLLGVITFTSLAIAGYYIFKYGAAYLHSDVAVSQRYARSVIESKSIFPSTWNFANGEIYSFRVIPFATLLSILITNQVLARLLASFLSLLLVCFAIVLFSKKYLHNNSWMIIVPVFVTFIGGSEAKNMILNEGVYQLEMLGMALCSWWLFNILNSERIKNCTKEIIGLFVLFFLMGLQGQRHWAETILPFLLAVFAYQFYEIREDYKGKLAATTLVGIKTSLVFLVPAVIGHFAYKKVCSTHLMNFGKGEMLYFPTSFKKLSSQFMTIIRLFFETFGYDPSVNAFSLLGIRNLVSIFMCVIICFVVPWLQFKTIKEESKQVKFLFFFGLMHNFVMLTIDICFAKGYQRYILGCIYVCLLISGRYIYDRWIKQAFLDSYIWTALFSIAAIIEISSLFYCTDGQQKYYDSNKRVCQELLNHNLSKGFGTYWNSYTFEAYSDGRLRFGAINASETGFDAFLALNDSSLYFDESVPTFVILSEDEVNGEYGYDLGFLETPYDEFIIEDVYLYNVEKLKYYKSNLYVYIYDYDVASRIKNGFSDGILTVKDMEFNWLGTKDWNQFYLDNGGMAFGPYGVIEPGDYVVTYEGENLTGLACDVYSQQEAKEEICNYSFIEKERTTTSITQIVSIDKTIRDIQFRATNVGDTQIILKDILVEKIK